MSNDAKSNLPQQSRFQDLTPPPQIDSIEIIELLGKGGMSLVYKARQKQLDRIVAVKILSKMAVSGEDGIRRFQKEAKLTSTLDHPNIVKTISFGVSNNGQPYLVMEYLEGLSLADDLKQNGRLKLQKFKDVFLPALSALGQAHQAGIIHRDLKPGNIMICRTDSGAETVKLVDFGIARVYGEGASETLNLTKSGAVLGSPTYMSPEQCLGKALDGRSDLYSMACVMYETLSGEPPFSGDSILEVMQKHSTEPPPTVSDLSRKIDIRKELAQVTLWGLAKDPAARPQTASEFARKLSEVLDGITLEKVPTLRMPAAESSRIMVLAIALLVIVVIVAAAAITMNWHGAESRRMVAFVPKNDFHIPLKTQLLHAKLKTEDALSTVFKGSLGMAETYHAMDPRESEKRLRNLYELASEKNEPIYQVYACGYLAHLYNEQLADFGKLNEQLSKLKDLLSKYPVLKNEEANNNIGFSLWIGDLSKLCQDLHDQEFFLGYAYKAIVSERSDWALGLDSKLRASLLSEIESLESRYVSILRKNGKLETAKEVETLNKK